MYYLDDIHEDNGSLLIIPGSHRKVLNKRIPDYGPIPKSVRLTCKAGSAVFFYMNVWHAVDENRSSLIVS